MGSQHISGGLVKDIFHVIHVLLANILDHEINSITVTFVFVSLIIAVGTDRKKPLNT